MKWLLLLMLFAGCDLPTVDPEQEPPEQAHALGVHRYCIQYFVPSKEYDKAPDASARCSDGSSPEAIGITYAPPRNRSCEETYLIPANAKQVYGCLKRPPITAAPI